MTVDAMEPMTPRKASVKPRSCMPALAIVWFQKSWKKFQKNGKSSQNSLDVVLSWFGAVRLIPNSLSTCASSGETPEQRRERIQECAGLRLMLGGAGRHLVEVMLSCNLTPELTALQWQICDVDDIVVLSVVVAFINVFNPEKKHEMNEWFSFHGKAHVPWSICSVLVNSDSALTQLFCWNQHFKRKRQNSSALYYILFILTTNRSHLRSALWTDLPNYRIFHSFLLRADETVAEAGRWPKVLSCLIQTCCRLHFVTADV